MVATAPSMLAGPPAQGRSASRIASDRQGATEISPENAAFEHLAPRRPARGGAPCLGRTRPQRPDAHRGRRRFSGPTRNGRYSRARYYHPGLQRFISEDPIGFAGGDPNLYAYVSNSPANFTDSSGLVVDIALDAAFIGYDLYRLVTGGRKDLAENLLALGADVVGAVVPGVTGLGAGVRAAKALPAARQVTAKWGASVYRHGGLMTGMEHIMYRHAAHSGFANVSRFAHGTTAKHVVGYIDDALRHGMVSRIGPDAYMVEHNLGRAIGTDAAGNAASWIRVYVQDGIIQSAFPF